MEAARIIKTEEKLKDGTSTSEGLMLVMLKRHDNSHYKTLGKLKTGFRHHED